MGKTIKFLIICLAIGLIAIGVIWQKNYASRPILVKPLPYSYPSLKDTPLISMEKPPQVLITGDRMALSLSRYKKALEELLSKEKRVSIRVGSLTGPHDSLARTLEKLKALPKLPPLIIYHGVSSELYEKKFLVSDYENLLYNWNVYTDPTKGSLITTIPFLSKFLYRPFTAVNLAKRPAKNPEEYSGSQFQKVSELSFKYFEEEFLELIRYVFSQQSQLIIVTTPLNLLVPPKKVCSNADESSLGTLLTNAKKLMDEKKTKEAFSKLDQLKTLGIGHADFHFLMGQAYLAQGQRLKAIKELELASVYDCSAWRANQVFNNIMTNYSSKFGVSLIDFHAFASANLSDDVIFLDELYPQDLYYQKVMALVAKRILEYL